MRYHSDPTANKALGPINREFARLEKKAKKLRKLLKEGRISPKDLEKAQAEFTGIYRHVLNNVLAEKDEETPRRETGGEFAVRQRKLQMEFRLFCQ